MIKPQENRLKRVIATLRRITNCVTTGTPPTDHITAILSTAKPKNMARQAIGVNLHGHTDVIVTKTVSNV